MAEDDFKLEEAGHVYAEVLREELPLTEFARVRTFVMPRPSDWIPFDGGSLVLEYIAVAALAFLLGTLLLPTVRLSVFAPRMAVRAWEVVRRHPEYPSMGRLKVAYLWAYKWLQFIRYGPISWAESEEDHRGPSEAR